MAKDGVPGESAIKRAVTLVDPPRPDEVIATGALFGVDGLNNGRVMLDPVNYEFLPTARFTSGIAAVRLCQDSFSRIADKMSVKISRGLDPLEAVAPLREELDISSRNAFQNAGKQCTRYCFVGLLGYCPLFFEERKPTDAEVVVILGGRAKPENRVLADIKTTQPIRDIGILSYNSGAQGIHGRRKPKTIHRMDQAVSARIIEHVSSSVAEIGLTPFRSYTQPTLI
jgi:hypothetical protein